MSREDGYPIGVYTAAARGKEASSVEGDSRVLRWLRTQQPLRAAAFHPTEPLLVLGTGSYDGGYFFEGQLALVNLVSGEIRYLLADDCSREVRSLEWRDAHTLRLLVAPPDDWEDRTAWSEGHQVDITHPNWQAFPERSLAQKNVIGPRVPAPRHEPTPPVAGPQRDGRSGEIRSLTTLPDRDLLVTADHIVLERWSAAGERRWSLPVGSDLRGGRLAVVIDDSSAWVEALGHRLGEGGDFICVDLAEGIESERHTTPEPAALVSTSQGPLLVPMPAGHDERVRSLFRHGPYALFRETSGLPCTCECPWDDDENCECQCACPQCSIEGGDQEAWLTTIDGDPTGDPARLAFAAEERCRRLVPWSWEPGEIHCGGPGAWITETDLIMATVRHDGWVGVPKQGFVTRRAIGKDSTGIPTWVFRINRTPTALDIDVTSGTVLVALRGGELISLDATTGALRARGHVTVRGVPVIPTALTITGPGQFLLGTSDARVLTCHLKPT